MEDKKTIKKTAKSVLKKNKWILIFTGIIMVALGEYSIEKDSASNIRIIYELISDKINGKEIKLYDKDNREVIINNYLDQTISQLFSGTTFTITKTIEKYNQEHNVKDGVFYSIFSIISKGQTQLQNFGNSIKDYSTDAKSKSILFIFATSIGLLIRAFVADPLTIGEKRIYLESINYHKTKLIRITFPFKKENYFPIVKSMFVRWLYQYLWNLTIVGGIIKNYSYKMVPFIIAENPKIKPKDAIKMSREMMNGQKWNAFKLDLSFIGWIIITYITLGIAGIYFVPYYTTTFSIVYRNIREKYIEDKKYKYELLNDKLLFEKNISSIYPNLDTPRNYLSYTRTYDIPTIVLFFFIFSFAGWVWEVFLFLFKFGVFVNRGALYGPWLPIYGFGCSSILLISSKFKKIRSFQKNPLITFLFIMIFCSILEYVTSWVLETTTGIKYWDYSNIFMNINGRICLENSLFFGLGGTLCTYVVGPFLEKKLSIIPIDVKIRIDIILLTLILCDTVYTHFYRHTGNYISDNLD